MSYTHKIVLNGKNSIKINVTEQQTEFLGWKVIPARLDATRTAWFLGFDPHEIPVLVGSGLLKPLGHPARNSTKFFATETLGQYRRDEKWLARASDAIASYWRDKNSRRGIAPLLITGNEVGVTNTGHR